MCFHLEVNFFSMNVNEVTTTNNQQWINIHLYLIKIWRSIPILLTLECVEMGANINNIIRILLKCMVKYEGLSNEGFSSRVPWL